MATANTKGMRTINIHQAKTHLSRLVDEVVEGEPFIIAKAGKPKVRVVPLDAQEAPKKRRIGSLKGYIRSRRISTRSTKSWIKRL